MTHIEALKLALQAYMKAGIGNSTDFVLQSEAYYLAVEVLAQPEQETQAYREAAQLAEWLFKTHYAQKEHYASGRVVWGLCDTTAGVISQIDNMVCKLVLPKEPEQPPQPQQEPVAWRPKLSFPIPWVTGAPRAQDIAHWSNGMQCEIEYAYTSPPQRTWVGLTDEEAIECWPGLAMYADCAKFWENIEAKLKAKNEH